MLADLERLAARSAQLRQATLEKRSGLLGLAAKGVGNLAASAGRGVIRAGQYALKKPGTALGVGLGGTFGTMGTIGAYKQYKSGFDPQVQQMMQGRPPVPPGA